MRKIKYRIQCKCQKCGLVWMDTRQWSVCANCSWDDLPITEAAKEANHETT